MCQAISMHTIMKFHEWAEHYVNFLWGGTPPLTVLRLSRLGSWVMPRCFVLNVRSLRYNEISTYCIGCPTFIKKSHLNDMGKEILKL